MEAGFYSSLPLQYAGRLLPQNPANMGDQTEYIDKKSLFAWLQTPHNNP
jgi:hypothetical protein